MNIDYQELRRQGRELRRKAPTQTLQVQLHPGATPVEDVRTDNSFRAKMTFHMLTAAFITAGMHEHIAEDFAEARVRDQFSGSADSGAPGSA